MLQGPGGDAGPMSVGPEPGVPTVLPYRGEQYYTLRLQGLEWRLPLVQVAPDTWIAYFDSLGDARLVRSSAEALAPHFRDADILMTCESKGIALAHEIAARLGQDTYIVCRKERKAFMLDPLVERYKPVTASRELELCIDSRYVPRIRGRRVGVVDDIVSTRATVDAMVRLAERAGGRVVRKGAILVEGAIYDDIVYLGVLPIFKRM